ncbi:MAG: restriction endonuclease [Opitutaceae bacterium]
MKGILVIMALFALAVGGITHAAEVLVSMVVLGLAVVVTVGGLLLVWKAQRLKLTTKGAITLFVAAGIFFWFFFHLQPPVEWPAVDLRVTDVTPGTDSRNMVQGLVQDGLFAVQVMVPVPKYTKLPAAGQSLRIYRNPEDGTQFSVLPEVTDGQFRHLGLLAVAGLAFAGGAGCGVSSWRQRHDDPQPPLRKSGAPDWDPSTWPSISATRKCGETQMPLASANTANLAPTVDTLWKIDWYQFEKLMERLLKLEGYNVTRFGGARPDGGVDVLATRDGKKTVIQCKHWKRLVKSPTVQQAIGIRVSQNADEVVLATLNSGTSYALRLAAKHKVVVIGADEIYSRMRRVGLSGFADLLDPDAKFCPCCDAPMVRRTWRGKAIWGCTNYGPLGCPGKIEA